MLSVTIDEVPEAIVQTAAIYEVRVRPVDVRGVLEIVAGLGIAPRLESLTWEQDLNWITASDNMVTLGVHELSGGLSYRLRPLADEPGVEVNTSASRLEEIARAFLDQLGRPSEPMRLERITYLHAQSADAGGAVSEPSTLDAGLVFTRTVDDLPVVGTGGLAMVMIGTDESVVGGREVWRPVAQGGEKVPLRTPEEATDLLQAKLKRSGIDGEVHVRKARQGYLENGIEESQRSLEPCYAFVVETVGGIVDSKTIEVIPAARVGPMASTLA